MILISACGHGKRKKLDSLECRLHVSRPSKHLGKNQRVLDGHAGSLAEMRSGGVRGIAKENDVPLVPLAAVRSDGRLTRGQRRLAKCPRDGHIVPMLWAIQLYLSDTGLAMHLAQLSAPTGAHLGNIVSTELLAWRETDSARPVILY